MANTITIANGATTSTTFNVGHSPINRVSMVGQNAGADTLTFQVSEDGTTFTNMRLLGPSEVTPVSVFTITPAVATLYSLTVPPWVFQNIRFLRVLSSAPISSSGCTITFY
jgi:hypothetical protein